MIVADIAQHMTWYVARSSGLIAFIILTVSTAIGLTLSTRLFGKSVAPAWLLGMHRYCGALGIFATLAHLVALFLDKAVNFTIADLLIPFAASWRPGAIAWGIAAFWCLIMVEATSLLMRKMSRKIWHTIHMTSFVMFASALVHGLQSGADAHQRVVQVGAITTTMTVLFLGLVRYLAPRRQTAIRVPRTPTAQGAPTTRASRQAGPSIETNSAAV